MKPLILSFLIVLSVSLGRGQSFKQHQLDQQLMEFQCRLDTLPTFAERQLARLAFWDRVLRETDQQVLLDWPPVPPPPPPVVDTLSQMPRQRCLTLSDVLRAWKRFKAECWADSTARIRKAGWRAATEEETKRFARDHLYYYKFSPDIVVRTYDTTWTHREPTLSGLMYWLEKQR